jgi:hypothetical protein
MTLYTEFIGFKISKTQKQTMDKFELAEKILAILDDADLTDFDKMAIIVEVKKRLVADNKMRMQREIYEQLRKID